MAGTAAGGRLAAAKNKKRDPDFYKRIGAMGGRAGHTGGFAAGEAGRRQRLRCHWWQQVTSRHLT